MNLVPCPSCTRHVKTTEAACPFCKTTLWTPELESTVIPGATQRLSRAAAFAFTASVMVTGCGATEISSAVGDSGAGDAQGIVDDSGGGQAIYGAPVPAYGAPMPIEDDAGSDDAATDAGKKLPIVDSGFDSGGGMSAYGAPPVDAGGGGPAYGGVPVDAGH